MKTNGKQSSNITATLPQSCNFWKKIERAKQPRVQTQSLTCLSLPPVQPNSEPQPIYMVEKYGKGADKTTRTTDSFWYAQKWAKDGFGKDTTSATEINHLNKMAGIKQYSKRP
jgi:hypothetical protein